MPPNDEPHPAMTPPYRFSFDAPLKLLHSSTIKVSHVLSRRHSIAADIFSICLNCDNFHQAIICDFNFLIILILDDEDFNTAALREIVLPLFLPCRLQDEMTNSSSRN
jgi:hypothetical protein